MQKRMKSTITTKKPSLAATVLGTSIALMMMSIAPTAAMADDGYRQINDVSWDKTGDGFHPVNPQSIPANKSHIVFMRPVDGDRLQTSANIGIDGDFQVSLQPGHFSEALVCSGEHRINITPTGRKTNELSGATEQLVELSAGQSHYFYVEVDDATGVTQLTEITAPSAADILAIKKQQTHQISRVVAENCPEPVVVVIPPVVIEPPIIEPPVEIKLDQPIALDVLFKFDSAKIQPVYNERIQAVADFMNEYPTTVTRIEGHTDSTGPAKYNLGLSKRRANAVAAELVNKYGANPARIATAGFGETQPTASNDTRGGRQQNRRVLAIVTEE